MTFSKPGISCALRLGLACLFFPLLPNVNAADCAALPSDAVAWWAANGDANDAIGSHNGTFSNSSFDSGEVGQAFSLDGSGNILIPASPTLDVGQSNGMTIEAWINPVDLTSGAPILEWAQPGTYATHFWVSGNTSGSLYANLFGVDNLSRTIESASGLLTDGVFQHVALTYDKASGVARLFLNGAMVKQMTLGSFTPRTSPNLYIGYRPDTSPFGPIAFVGLIDEVTLYSRALSTNEIQAIYNAGSAGKCVGAKNPLPSLSIIRNGTNVLLTWPPDATNFSLQVAYTSLSPTATWTNAGVQPVFTNNQNVATLPINATAKFFRLYHP